MNFQFRASLKYTQTRDITSSGKYFMHGQDDNILWISYIMRCGRIFAGTLGLYLNYSRNLGLGLNELCTVIRIYTLRFLGIYTNRNSELNYIFLERKRTVLFLRNISVTIFQFPLYYRTSLGDWARLTDWARLGVY